MPKQVGKSPSSFTVTYPKNYITTDTTQSLLTSSIPEKIATILTCGQKESALIDSLAYGFWSDEPVDGEVNYIIFTIEDVGSYAIGDTARSLAELLGRAIYWHGSQIQLSGTSWILQSPFQFADIPDVLLHEDKELALWGSITSGTMPQSLVVPSVVSVIRKLYQQAHPNDNAFSDMSWEEVIGNIN